MNGAVPKCNSTSYCKLKIPVMFNYKCNNHDLNRGSQITDLWIVFDNKLTFNHHVNIISKSHKVLGFIDKITRTFQSIDTLKLLFNSFVGTFLIWDQITIVRKTNIYKLAVPHMRSWQNNCN